MKSNFRSLVVLFPFLLPQLTSAQQQTFTVVPESSEVVFTLGASDHPVKGTFHVQSGIIKFDQNVPNISGAVVVAAASGSSGNQGRDKKMNNDVLDVAHFTEVSFAPKSYQGTIAANGDSTIQVAGTFTLHGTAHDISVSMQIHIDGTNLTAKGHFTVPYVKWGLKDPSIFILKVAKEVGIDLTLVGHLSPSN